MPSEIRKVAVIGSGAMGGQIAAQVANAGTPVLLLDIVPKDAVDRNVLARGAVERMLKADPSPFTHPDAARLVLCGNIDDDLGRIKDCDWIVEAVLENPKIKSDLYRKIDALRKEGSVVTSKTMTIPLARLIGDQSLAFGKDFMISHFFNPVRYMRLLELVVGPKTDPRAIALVRSFCDHELGKGVVVCNDTPGAIAHRLGLFWLQAAVNAAMDLGLTVEEADAVCGAPMGFPAAGVFGLLDRIGIDLLPTLSKNLLGALGPSDTYRGIYQEPELFQKMMADGLTGRNGRGGFYRAADGQTKESINLETGVYGPSVTPDLPALKAAGGSLRALCESPDKIGQFAWRVLSETVCYAFNLLPATVSDVTRVDEAMRLGYNWTYGPFELLDRMGADWVIARLKEEGRPVPDFLARAAGKSFYTVEAGRMMFLQMDGQYAPVRRPEGLLMLADIKRASKPVNKSDTAALWNIGDGVLCLEFTGKDGVLDAGVFEMMESAITIVGTSSGQWKGLVLYHDGPVFSTGMDLAALAALIKQGQFTAIETLVKKAQTTLAALRFAPFPSIAAPFGAARGAGCEVALHCAAVQTDGALSIGLDAVNVGLVPAWGGCAQLLGRVFSTEGYEEVPPVNHVFALLMSAWTSQEAVQAKAQHYLQRTDRVSMNPDRLLSDAKARLLEMAHHYKPPSPWEMVLPGPAGRASLELILETSKPTPHTRMIGKMLADVLCGDGSGSGLVGEKQVMDVERDVFMKLVRMPETLARIEHWLETGAPLKN